MGGKEAFSLSVSNREIKSRSYIRKRGLLHDLCFFFFLFFFLFLILFFVVALTDLD